MKYLRGVGDAGTRLLLKFRSGTHGLNEELGRHRGREGRKECLLCDAECESVSHVLWDCPAYASIRSAFMLELRRELGDRFEHFQSLDGNPRRACAARVTLCVCLFVCYRSSSYSFRFSLQPTASTASF